MLGYVRDPRNVLRVFPYVSGDTRTSSVISVNAGALFRVIFSRLEVAHFEPALRKSSGVFGGLAWAQASGLAGVPGAVTPMGPRRTTKPHSSIDFALAGAPLWSIFAYFRDLLLAHGSAEALTRHVRRG